MRLTQASAASVLLVLLCGCARFQSVPLPPAESLLPVDTTAELASVDVEHPLLSSRPVDPRAPLSAMDAARLALILSPDLIAVRKQTGVAEAQLFASGLLPDPQLTLSLDRPQNMTLVNAVAAGIGVDLVAWFSRNLRQQSSRHALEQMRDDVAWTEWLALNQVRLLVVRLQSLRQQMEEAESAVDTADRLYRLSVDNLQRGDARVDDASLYQVGFIDANDRLLALQREVGATGHQLNAAIGLPPQSQPALAPLPALPNVSTINADALVRKALAKRLDIQALAAGYEVLQSSAKATARSSLPLPQLNLSRARDTGAVWSHGIGIGVALPLWNRGRGDLAVASASRDQLAAEYAARVAQTQSDVVSQLDDLRALERQVTALQQQLPTLRDAAEVVQGASRRGDVALTTYETLRASLLDKELTLLALQQAWREGAVALETAAGQLIWDEQP